MNVTPLVDVVLVLLIIFMVVAPRMDQDVQIELPGILNPDPDVESQLEPLKLDVARRARSTSTSRSTISTAAIDVLSAEHAVEPYRRLVLRADEALTYGQVRPVLAKTQQVGFPGMSLMVGEKHRAGAPAPGSTARGLAGTRHAANTAHRRCVGPEATAEPWRSNVGGGGSGKRVQPSMNVTPLVDVVLVLLIIFMVITPLLTKKFWVHTPKQEKEEVKQEDLRRTRTPPLVLYVGADKKITVNGTEVGFEELSDRLKRMFAARDDHILFFDAHDDASTATPSRSWTSAREGGAVTIATLSTGLTSAPARPANRRFRHLARALPRLRRQLPSRLPLRRHPEVAPAVRLVAGGSVGASVSGRALGRAGASARRTASPMSPSPYPATTKPWLSNHAATRRFSPGR